MSSVSTKRRATATADTNTYDTTTNPARQHATAAAPVSAPVSAPVDVANTYHDTNSAPAPTDATPVDVALTDLRTFAKALDASSEAGKEANSVRERIGDLVFAAFQGDYLDDLYSAMTEENEGRGAKVKWRAEYAACKNSFSASRNVVLFMAKGKRLNVSGQNKSTGKRTAAEYSSLSSIAPETRQHTWSALAKAWREAAETEEKRAAKLLDMEDMAIAETIQRARQGDEKAIACLPEGLEAKGLTVDDVRAEGSAAALKASEYGRSFALAKEEAKEVAAKEAAAMTALANATAIVLDALKVGTMPADRIQALEQALTERLAAAA